MAILLGPPIGNAPLVVLPVRDVTLPAGLVTGPATGMVTVTGFAPRSDSTVAPGVGNIVVTGFAPTLVTNASSSSPPTGAIAITGFAPSSDVGPFVPPIVSTVIPPPPTRLLNWQQLVLEEEPDWGPRYRRPWIYEFPGGRRFAARDPLYAPSLDSGLINDGGVVELVDAAGYPLSPLGLSAGALWTEGGIIVVIPGAMPPHIVMQPLLFTGLTASQLLRNGGANLPTDPTGLIEDQVWNNGGLVCVFNGVIPPPVTPPDTGGGFFILDQSLLDGSDVLS